MKIFLYIRTDERGEVFKMSDETNVTQETGNVSANDSMANYEDRLDPDNFDAPVWEKFQQMMKDKEVFTVIVKGVVNGGLVTYVNDVRAFIPKSHVARTRIEDLNTMLDKELEVRIIEAEQTGHKLVLSAREVLRDRDHEAKAAAVDSVPVGAVAEGTVETLKPYGAFIRLENGLSGLVHISQISQKRIKTPEEVLHTGDTVKVKVIAVKDGKLSLSIKALSDKDDSSEIPEKVVIPKAEKISTNLGDLLKGIKL